MNIHIKLEKVRENLVKTISLGEGLRYDLSCTPMAFKAMSNWSLGPSNCETKFIFKQFGMGYVKMHGFNGNRLYDSRDWG